MCKNLHVTADVEEVVARREEEERRGEEEGPFAPSQLSSAQEHRPAWWESIINAFSWGSAVGAH